MSVKTSHHVSFCKESTGDKWIFFSQRENNAEGILMPWRYDINSIRSCYWKYRQRHGSFHRAMKIMHSLTACILLIIDQLLLCTNASLIITVTSNHRCHDCLLNRLFRCRKKKQQRKHQCSASLAFVRRIHRWPLDSLTKGQLCENVSTWWRPHVI